MSNATRDHISSTIQTLRFRSSRFFWSVFLLLHRFIWSFRVTGSYEFELKWGYRCLHPRYWKLLTRVLHLFALLQFSRPWITCRSKFCLTAGLKHYRQLIPALRTASKIVFYSLHVSQSRSPCSTLETESVYRVCDENKCTELPEAKRVPSLRDTLNTLRP